MMRLVLAYLALAALYLAAFEHNTGWMPALFKALPILLLAFASACAGSGRWRVWMCVALLFSALGDVLLALPAVPFAAGLAAFLVAQLVYAQLFWRARGRDPRRMLAAALYLPVAAALAWFTLPAAGTLAPAVALYMLAITAMVTGAALAERPLSLLAGALFFALSDALIAIDRFIEPLTHAGLSIMCTYYLAQLLIWHGAHATPAEARA